MATANKKSAGKDPRVSKGATPPTTPKKTATADPPTPSPSGAPAQHMHDTALSASSEVKQSRRKLASGEERVTVRIPRAFNLQVLDSQGSRIIRYEAGTDEMPRSHAEHEYAINHGVEIVDA